MRAQEANYGWFNIVVIFLGTIWLQNDFAINFRGNSSYIHVSPGASFVLNQPLNSINGTILKIVAQLFLAAL